jgi:hypothetical protein
MRKNYIIWIIAAICSFSLWGCKKMHGHDESKEVVLNINLARGAAYALDLSQYGDDDGDEIASIETQATEFDRSEIVGSQKYTYHYIASATPKFSNTGKDKVVLKVAEKNSGRCRNKKEQTTITINFSLQ